MSLLQAVLVQAGIECRTHYLNLDYASRVGISRYQQLAEEVPAQLLLGDLVFRAALYGEQLPLEEVRRTVEASHAQLDSRLSIPPWFFTDFDELSAQATQLVDDFAGSVGDDYDLIGVTAMFQLLPALAVSQGVKKRLGDRAPRLVLGGSHCEGEMGLAIHEVFDFVDFVARGEGERLLLALCRHLEAGSTKVGKVPGLVWRSADGASVENGERGAVSAMDALPLPDYADWIDQSRGHSLVDPAEWMFPVETSRGCWYGEKNHCTFCGLNGEHMEYRRKSPERALEEFTHVAHSGAKTIHATDNILDFRYFDSLLPALAERQLELSIFYEVKANLKEAHVRQMVAAGITSIQPGIESLSTPLLKLMNKGVSSVQNVRLLRLAAQYDVVVAWNLLYGFPGESIEGYLEMIELIPSLAHLPPPLYPCNRVRADRFSPLFETGSELGVAEVSPCPNYSLALQLEPEQISRIAYYFDHRAQSPDRSDAYLADLRAAVERWQGARGNAAFVSVQRQGKLILADDRAGADTNRVELEGSSADIYRATMNGCSRRRLGEQFGPAGIQVDAVIDEFLEHRWAVELDGQVLGLAVPMDAAVEDIDSGAVASAVAQMLYKERLGARQGVTLGTTD